MKKIQTYKDRTLSTDAFKAWKSSLMDLGAQFVANTRYGMNVVRLEGCEVTFSRPETPMTNPSESANADLDAQWNSVLGLCQSFGFEPY